MLARRAIAGNAHLLPIDRFDPSLALYLPLWYPHGDMTGSTIYSYDKNRHTCTVAGALWGYQGRSFDGTDDVINCGSATALNNLTGPCTIEAWVNPTSLGENNLGNIVNKGTFLLGETATAAVLFRIYTTAWKNAQSANNSVPLGSWSHIVGVYNGANVLVYTNLTLVTGDVATGAISDHSASSLLIGDSAASSRCFDGRIGEARVYNRALSLAEVTSNNLATKWRYQ